MKTVYVIITTLFLMHLQASAQTWDWTKPEPNGSLTPNSEHDDAHDVEVDASGNAYVLGDFLDSLFLNNVYKAKGSGSYLAKYDSTGALLWYKLIIPTSLSGGIKATDLTVTPQGVFIVGKYSPSNTGISSYDCNGGGTGTINSYSIGNYNFNSGIYNEAGVFVTKFNSNGGVIWNQVVKGQVCFDNSYNASVGETSYNPLITSDKNNNIICEFLYTHIESKRTSLSIGTGTIPLPLPVLNVNNFTCIVFKMNNAGTLLWSNYAAEQEMSSASNECNSIITDNDGNVFLYGTANDGCAFGSNIFHTTEFIKNGNRSWSRYIAKISGTGTWNFVKELHNSGQNILELGVGNPDKLAVDNANNIYALANVGGNGVYGIIAGDTVPVNKTSTYLVKLDNSGNLIWHNGFGETTTISNSIHFANNALYISGRIRNYVNAGYLWYFSDLYINPSSPFGGGAYWEYFVAKANTAGNFQWVSSFSGDDVFFLPESFAVKAFGTNIYTSGYYRGNINSLGNFSSKYTGDASTHNLFFGKLKDQYIKVGAVSASEVVPGCSITIPFTSNGLTFSASNSFIAELSNTNWEFTNPTVMGSVTSTGNGVINAVVPASLPFGTSGYKIRIRSTDTLLTGLNYYAYADTGYTLKVLCPTPSTGFAATNITNASATVNWASVACGAGYRVQYRAKGGAAWITATTITNNNTTSFNLTGLTANTTYQWRIATRCRSNGLISFSAYTTAKQFKTAVALIASSINAVKHNGQTTMIVQPNPATNSAILSVKGNVKNATVSIVDFVGKTVWKKNGVNAGQLMLPVQNLSAGIYLVKLVNGNETKIVKLVKE
ncbi:hypothetical protein BH10BAC2_BH10BAC2_09010 [soil metagenome]